MTKRVSIGTKPTSKPDTVDAANAWVETRSATDDEPIKRLTIDIPESMHRRIKAACAARGKKISDEVRELLLQKYGKG